MPAERARTDPRITLLGPQRQPRVAQATERLGLRGARFATITAGWRDRESEDAELTEQLGGNAVNLRLWALMQRLWEADPELAAADQRRRLQHTEMQELYLIGVEHAADAMRRVSAHTPREPRVVEQAVEDVLQVMRDLDRRHLERVTELNEAFYARYQPQHRDAVVQGRFHVGRLISGCEAIAITGGHVGVLMGALHVFNLGPALAAPAAAPGQAPALHRPIVAWGAGAMVLTEQVLLYYDHAVADSGVSEMLMEGLGLTSGIVALPSPKERLDVRNTWRMSALARRVAPARALLLDAEAEVTLTADGRLPAGARVLGQDGHPIVLEADDVAPGLTSPATATNGSGVDPA